VFTLPICLRDPRSPGYPRSDAQVHQYFSPHMEDGNDLDMDAHIRMASFIAAAHRIMLGELQELQETALDGERLLANWHDAMEDGVQNSAFRQSFFDQVVYEAEDLRTEVVPAENRNRIASGYRCRD
jgi:hypothetical protein